MPVCAGAYVHVLYIVFAYMQVQFTHTRTRIKTSRPSIDVHFVNGILGLAPLDYGLIHKSERRCLGIESYLCFCRSIKRTNSESLCSRVFYTTCLVANIVYTMEQRISQKTICSSLQPTLYYPCIYLTPLIFWATDFSPCNTEHKNALVCSHR